MTEPRNYLEEARAILAGKSLMLAQNEHLIAVAVAANQIFTALNASVNGRISQAYPIPFLIAGPRTDACPTCGQPTSKESGT